MWFLVNCIQKVSSAYGRDGEFNVNLTQFICIPSCGKNMHVYVLDLNSGTIKINNLAQAFVSNLVRSIPHMHLRSTACRHACIWSNSAIFVLMKLN